MNIREFLNLIGSSLRKDRPLVPTNYNYTIKNYNGFIHFWFRTEGCKYTKGKNGGCLMFDYSSSSKSDIQEMKKYILEGLNKIGNPYLLLINSSGSFLDDNEVPKEIRVSIYKHLQHNIDLEIILETLLETITQNKLKEIRNILKYQIIDIEFGIEAFDTNILKYCINKNLNLKNISQKIELLHKYKINSVANVLVGIPFLNEYQNIQTAVNSINSLLKKGVDTIVLFPVNIKPYTIVFWLFRNGFYKSISLWSYIEVLNKIETKYLNNIELSWYKDTSKNPIYKNGVTAPITCLKCNNEVLSLLDEFSQSKENRIEILNKLNQIKCDCKDKWKDNLNNKENLKDNILKIFPKMANQILNENFWQKNGKILEKEILNDFKSL